MTSVLNTCVTCGGGPSAPQHRDRSIAGSHRFASELMTRAELHAREVGIDFDEANHLYRTPNGVRVPSVTQILRDEGFVDYTWCDEFARDRGSRAHEAIHYMCEGDLDRESLDPEHVAPYVSAAEAFLSDMEADIVVAEAVIFSELYGYAGKADLFAYLRNRRRLACVDWKSGAPVKATGLQLAGYSGAWLEMTGEAVIDRIAVQLTPGKTKPYRIHEYIDRGDLAVFRGAAASHNWKRRHHVSSTRNAA